MTDDLQHRGARRALIINAAFLALLWLPLVVSTTGGLKRMLAQPHPAASLLRAVRDYLDDTLENPRTVSWSFEGNFGLRTPLIRWHGRLNVYGLGVASTPRVVVGKDGWLFYTRNATDGPLPPQRPFMPAELAQWQQTLEARQDWLHAHGARYLLVLTPDKQAFYGRYLPPTIGSARGPGRLDQLIRFLQMHSRVTVVDVRPALRAAAEQRSIYHKTDTHWNDWAAFVVCRRLLTELQPVFPGIQLPNESDFTITRKPVATGDLAALLGLEGSLVEPQVQLIPRHPRVARFPTGANEEHTARVMRAVVRGECPGAPVPRVVVLRDSFMTPMIPFLAEYFGHSLFLWTYDFDIRTMAVERPDVVIQEMNERNLQTVPPPPE